MPATWFVPIQAYCERTDATFWAEPINAVSNAAFLAAAFVVIRQEGRGRRPDPPVRMLAGLVALVGLGSFLFHTLAVRWSLLADVIPIALFIHAYFFLALRRFLDLGLGPALGLTLLFAGFGFGLEPALTALSSVDVDAASNGSIGYVPAILALVGVGAGLLRSQGHARGPARHAAGRALLGTAAVFGASLAFRTLDRGLCARLPMGTHCLWHLLNAGVLYGRLVAALRHGVRKA